MKKGVISIKKNGNAEFSTVDDDTEFVVMARGDFDGDGIKDMLIRARTGMCNASGVGFGLFLLSKKSASDPIVVKHQDK